MPPLVRFLYLVLLILSTVCFQFAQGQGTLQCNYTADIDQDDDGLIEICDLEGLDAIRYQLDGSGYRESFTEDKITKGCPRRGCRGYELSRDLSFNDRDSYRDIANKAAWTSGSGWRPIGDHLDTFTARFEANGHTISDLFIDSTTDYVGLFRKVGKSAKISRLTLSRVDVAGQSFIGSLAGLNAGIIIDVDVAEGRIVGVVNTIGGLVGANEGTIANVDVALDRVIGGVMQKRCREDLRSSDCSASEQIDLIVNNGNRVGGLVGYNEGRVSDSDVRTNLSGGSRVGGLVGLNVKGTLKNNKTDGVLVANHYVGGLVGFNSGSIETSYAEANVLSRNTYCGGLVGMSSIDGRIVDSYAVGDVAGSDYVGGLVGSNASDISNSFAMNDVVGGDYVGGLVGSHEQGRITNTYAQSSVRGANRIGGLIGANEGAISASLAIGQVVGSGSDIGGLVGWNDATRIKQSEMWIVNSYWDSEVSGISHSGDGVPRTTSQLKSPTAPGAAGETYQRWNVADWDFGTAEQYPMLKYAETSRRGALLSSQYTELADLSLSGGLELFPRFDTKLYDYRVKIGSYLSRIRLTPKARDDSAAIAIVTDSGVNITTDSGVVSDILLNDAPRETRIMIGNRYLLRVIRPLEAVSIVTDIQNRRINEGRRLNLRASAQGSDAARLHYNWRQISPSRPSLLRDTDTQQSELNIVVPTDFVRRAASATDVVLQVVVSDGETTLIRNKTVTIVKQNNGSLASLAAPSFESGVLSVRNLSEEDLSMDSDGGGIMKSIRYQWQSKQHSADAIWQDIKDADSHRYQLSISFDNARNIAYRMQVAYRDRQGYTNRITSVALIMDATDYDNDGLIDINYLEDLDAIRQQPDGDYELTRDLDFNDVGSYRNPLNKEAWTVSNYKNNADNGWLPLATTENPFTGSLEGNGYAILALQINRDSSNNQGLFGVIAEGAVISDVGLVNINIEGRTRVGGLVAINEGEITDSYVIGQVSGMITVGGLVGVNNQSAKIINSYTDSRVAASLSKAGGLVGRNDGVIADSRAIGNVLSVNEAGGLVAYNSGRISHSYADGSVNSILNTAGGLVGVNSSGGVITAAYASGNVEGGSNMGGDIGGLVGSNSGSVTYSYAVAAVQGRNDNIGGLVGSNTSAIEDSYWNSEISLAQGNNGEGQSTQQLRLPTRPIGIYRNWREDDWDFGTNKQYPILKYARNTDDDICRVRCGDLISPGLRYGLQSLQATSGELFPAFSVDKQNQTGIYIGTVSNSDATIRLTATAMDANTRLHFYVGYSEVPYDTIASGAMTKAIPLSADGVTRIIVEIEGEQRVRYRLYLNYRNTDSDGLSLINYIEDLDAIRQHRHGHYKLVRDLDFKDNASYKNLANKAEWTVDDYDDNKDLGWRAIGSNKSDRCDSSEYFRGVLDGNGYTIANLQINRDSSDNQGLFCATDVAAVIKGVALLNLNIEGARNSGGLVGVNNGKIEDSYVVGDIKYQGASSGIASIGGLVGHNLGTIIGSYAVVEISGHHTVGGLVGRNDEGFIINSFVGGMVSAESQAAGGLVGDNEGTIIHSHATSEIEAKTGMSIGGLVGVNSKRIIGSYARGNVKGQTDVGGLVGTNSGSIDDSYARGDVVGRNKVGGLVGRIDDGAFARSYATGEIKGSGTIMGGLVGSGSGSVVASYWDKTVNDGFDNSNGFARTTSRLQSGRAQQTSATMIYYRWSNANWDFGTDTQYPILKHADYSALGRATCVTTTSTAVSLPQCGALLSPELRHGLSELRTTNDTRLSPPFDVSRYNQNSVYFGRVLGNSPSIRLIATAIEATARINIYVGTIETVIDRNLANASESSDITLLRDGITRIIIEVSGTKTVRYTLFVRYLGKDSDGDGLVEINYLEDLDAIRRQGDDLSYELVGNLDFKDDASYRDLSNKAEWTVDDYEDSADNGWQPIGSFGSTFNGNGYTISNLQINRDGQHNQALFARIKDDAVIRNVGLLHVDIESGKNSGGLVADNEGTIISSYAVGEVSGKDKVGGLVGMNGRYIINSYAYGTVSANDRVGGLVGENAGTIVNSHAGGDISGISNIGGLVGWNSRGKIVNSYARGTVRGEDAVGGLVARLGSGAIINGYATGTVMGNRDIGGLVGWNSGTINHSYTVGNVIGVGNNVMNQGGLVGSGNITITASYWNTEIADGLANDGRGQTTKALQAPTDATALYRNWNSVAWDFGTAEQYPILRYGDYSGLGHASCATVAGSDILLPKCDDLISVGLRYGLREMVTANGAMFIPPFDIVEHNQSGVYIGTIHGDSNIIRLIPTAMESTARISIYVGDKSQTLASGEIGMPITLTEGDITQVIVDVAGTKPLRYSLYLNYAYRKAIADDEGYVAINYLEDLDAIRHQLDGSGYRRSITANKITIGCPRSRCRGYKLARDLDFNDVHSYRDASVNRARWTGDGSWTPIASVSEPFISTLRGDNRMISNLKVRADGGLFAAIGSDKHSSHIDGIALLGADIKGQRAAGLVQHCNGCVISNSYVIGTVEGVESAGGIINHVSAAADTQITNSYFIGRVIVSGQDAIGGGLIADIASASKATRISDSYAVGTVMGEMESGFIGSLIGVRTSGNVEINNSYASVLATRGEQRRGLFGGNLNPKDSVAPTVRESYSDMDIAEIAVTIGRDVDTEGLQSPTTATGIYRDWSIADWDFGTRMQYPALRYNLDSDIVGNDDNCSASDSRKIPMLCGRMLPHQGSLLRDLKLAAGAGFARPFAFTTFDYDISVNADQNAIRLTPTAFNPAATIEVFVDGTSVAEMPSGTLSVPIALHTGSDTIIELIVNDGERKSYRYQLTIKHLTTVAENIDKDNDGLIDIDDITHLNAIRNQLNGMAYREKGGQSIYCSVGCIGYELTADLDLDGMHWQPIGDNENPFTGLFKGNGHTISNLVIKAGSSFYTGLFAAIASDAVIENVGLINVDITGLRLAGGLVAVNRGKIINSFVTGKVAARRYVGGLTGWNSGSIINSYADIDGSGLNSGGLAGYSEGYIMNSYAHGKIENSIGGIGGLIGGHDGSAIIGNSYAVADVIANSFQRGVGGLTPDTDLTVSNSYYRSGSVVNGNNMGAGTSRTEVILKQSMPSDAVYSGWDRASWHFGNEDQYPALLYTATDSNNSVCKTPSAKQLSDCDMWLPSALSDDDKAMICRSHLQRSKKDPPYCGTLLPEQHHGLIRLDFSQQAILLPKFNPEQYDYTMMVTAGAEIHTTATAYYGGDTITMSSDDLNTFVAKGRQSMPITITNDANRIVYEVNAKNGQTITRYTIHVYDVTVADERIEIQYLEDLNIMRYPLARVSAVAEDCPLDANTRARQCKGYRLTRNLNFDDPTNYRSGIVNSAWTSGLGWQPIEDFASLFAADGHTISNLRINRPDIRSVGLFAATSANARIEGLGLLSVDINGYREVGALVGSNRGEIITSYVRGGGINGNKNSIGALVGANEGIILNSHANALVHLNGNGYVGGLVGLNKSRIYNSYAGSTVNSGGFGGGLVGYNNRGAIINSYASGDVSGPITGGLVGTNDKGKIINSYASGCLSGQSGLFGGSATVEGSYWDTTVSKLDDQNNNKCGRTAIGDYGKTTSELQSPTSNSGIYESWSLDDWYFGTTEEYPLLRYKTATDIVTTATCRDREDKSTNLPICGTLLSGQRAGLRNLALSKQVLLLEPAFDSGIFNYDLVLKKDENEFQMTVTMFDESERVIVSGEGLTDSQQSVSVGDTISSGHSALVSIGDADSAMMTLTTTATTMISYHIRISRHPFIGVDDIDEDGDGLIEVNSTAAFDAIRYQLDGSGYRSDAETIKINLGCPADGCIGYELTTDLDFGDWQPIGTLVMEADATVDCAQSLNMCFTGILEGNGHTISNLIIDNTRQDNVALFAALSADAQIKNLSLANVHIRGQSAVGSLAVYNAGLIANTDVNGTVVGNDNVGALVAHNTSTLLNSYAVGVVSGHRGVGGLAARNEIDGLIANSYALNRVSGHRGVGGLVGFNFGTIKNTYASGHVKGHRGVGGLVGINENSIADSYASVRVIATVSGDSGLVGSDSGSVMNSYWDIEASGVQGFATGLGKTTDQLKQGISQLLDPAQAYYGWNVADWYFGDAEQYPILKYAADTNKEVCGGDSQPNCGDLQAYGLADLSSVEVTTISPQFDATRLHYRVGVEQNRGIRHLRLIPTALDKNAVIRIFSDSFDETVESGTTSSAITLASTGTTVIYIEVKGDRTVSYKFDVNYFSFALEQNIDSDGDELIEIKTLEDLDAMRYALDGSRYRHLGSDGASVETAIGCPITGCKGYELTRDLDFNDAQSYRLGRVNSEWTRGTGWQPIGTSYRPFTAIFNGNGFTISNLKIHDTATDSGLFGVIESRRHVSEITQLGLLDVEINGSGHVGGLVGINRGGTISESYVIGSLRSIVADSYAVVGGLVAGNEGGIVTRSYAMVQAAADLRHRSAAALSIGGLVGSNTMQGIIENSYAIGSILSRGNMGGLVAVNDASSRVINSYAVNNIVGVGSDFQIGGLATSNQGSVSRSYWDSDISGIETSAAGSSQTTVVLQQSVPTSPPDSIYAAWQQNVWDFGDTDQYPILRSVGGALLSNQQRDNLLRDLTVSGAVKLFPSFHPLTFNYTMIAEAKQATDVRLKVVAPMGVNTTVDSYCYDVVLCSVEEDEATSATTVSFTLDGTDEAEITIVVNTPSARPQLYRLAAHYAGLEVNRMATTTETTVFSLLRTNRTMTFTVDEGERIRLKADYDSGLADDSYRYQWRQKGSDSLKLNDLLQPITDNQAIIDFTIPADVVSRDDDSDIVELTAEAVVGDIVYAEKTVPLTINKVNNDKGSGYRLSYNQVDATNKPNTYGVVLQNSGKADADKGLAENPLSVQWQRRRNQNTDWHNLGTDATYEIEGDYQYRVIGSYEDGQGYSHDLEGAVIYSIDIDADNDGLIEINYLEDLHSIRYHLNGSGLQKSAGTAKITEGCPDSGCKGYELVRDLDFLDDTNYRDISNKNGWTTGLGWQPIGGFKGIFKGNGYIISNLYINRPNKSDAHSSNVGLFSNIGGIAVVSDVVLANTKVTGHTHVGALVGSNYGTINKAYLTVGKVSGHSNVGGLAGRNWDTIINSYVEAVNSTSKIEGNSGSIGGLVGFSNGGKAYITNSYARINVYTKFSSSNKASRTGGLVGTNTNGGKIANSYAAGTVRGPCRVGGLVGFNWTSNTANRSTISNSYARGEAVTGYGACNQNSIRYAGGLVGHNAFNGKAGSKIEYSYAKVKVGLHSGFASLSEGGALGGLVAWQGGSAEIIHSYWEVEPACEFRSNNLYCYGSSTPVSNIEDEMRKDLLLPVPGIGSRACLNEKFNTAMCMTYRNWDNSDWDFGTDQQYPALKYAVGPDKNNPACGTDGLPNCGLLLPGQSGNVLLSDVLLSALSVSANSINVPLSPSFIPNQLNYDVVVESEVAQATIKIVASASGRTAITIVKDGETLTKNADGSVEFKIMNPLTQVTVKAASKNMRGATYTLRIHLKYPPQIKLSAAINATSPVDLNEQSVIALNEGDTITFNSTDTVVRNDELLIYKWSQISGPRQLTEVTSEMPYITKYTVPADFVPKDKSDSTITLKLEVYEAENPISASSREILLSVSKINNGDLVATVKWISSNTLAAAVDISTDADGGPISDINYAWSIEQDGEFQLITDAQQQSYTLAENARNALYRLSISYTDGQGYRVTKHYDAPRYETIANRADKDGDGFMEIENLEALNAIRTRLNGKYELTGDLDFHDDASYVSTSNKTTWTTKEGEGWQPIGSVSNPFTGVFEGNGYTIANLTINKPSTSYIGLFGYINNSKAEIRRIGLTNVSIVGMGAVGGLVGEFNGKSITRSYVSGTVTGMTEEVGGLVGELQGDIENSYAVGDVTGSEQVGGLVGHISGSSRIKNSYAVGNVTLTGDYGGGLVAHITANNVSIVNTYTDSNVRGNFTIGGLVGSNESGQISDSLALGNVTAFIIKGGLVGYSGTEINRSYWKRDTNNPIGSGNTSSANPNYKGFTAKELRSPTQAGTAVGRPYYNWSNQHWGFGTSEVYPALKYHDDTCDTSYPSPDCGKLLLYQHTGLRDLKIEQNGLAVQLSPSFDAKRTSYTITAGNDADVLRVTPIALNPDARIIADGKILDADSPSYLMPLNTVGPTSTVIRVFGQDSLRSEEPTDYKVTINNRSPIVTIQAPDSVYEGDVFRLNASIVDHDGDKLSYRLTATADILTDIEAATGEVVGHADLSFIFNIPEDLVDAMQLRRIVELALTVDDGRASVTEKVLLTIIKENNGVIPIPTPTRQGFVYTIPDIDLSADMDGVGSVPIPTYQWQSEIEGSWIDIEGATDPSYIIAGVIGDRYRVVIDYTDKQGYEHQGLASPPAAAAAEGVVYSSVTEDTNEDISGVLIYIKVFLESLLP